MPLYYPMFEIKIKTLSNALYIRISLNDVLLLICGMIRMYVPADVCLVCVCMYCTQYIHTLMVRLIDESTM